MKREANTEIAFFHRLQALQNRSQALRHRWFQRAGWIAVISILPADGRFNGRRHAGCSWVGSDHSALGEPCDSPNSDLPRRTNAGVQREK